MRNARTRFDETRNLPLGEMDGMPEIGPRPDQPEALVDVEIVACFGKKLTHPFDLIDAFRNVRLHKRCGICPPERPRHFELSSRRGRRKARRHCIDSPASLVPPLINASLSEKPRSGVSMSASGPLRSIITLPAHMRIPRSSAASKKASTEAGCVVQ